MRAIPRWTMRRYGLTVVEAQCFEAIEGAANRVELWREQNGLPAPDSPLVRGEVLEELRRAGFGFMIGRESWS